MGLCTGLVVGFSVIYFPFSWFFLIWYFMCYVYLYCSCVFMLGWVCFCISMRFSFMLVLVFSVFSCLYEYGDVMGGKAEEGGAVPTK